MSRAFKLCAIAVSVIRTWLVFTAIQALSDWTRRDDNHLILRLAFALRRHICIGKTGALRARVTCKHSIAASFTRCSNSLCVRNTEVKADALDVFKCRARGRDDIPGAKGAGLQKLVLGAGGTNARHNFTSLSVIKDIGEGL